MGRTARSCCTTPPSRAERSRGRDARASGHVPPEDSDGPAIALLILRGGLAPNYQPAPPPAGGRGARPKLMPPRFAYWTILIDDKPTAFRARDREELVPTFVQLRRTNPHVSLRWFAR